MAQYKLTYFNAKGRVEPTRYMFKLAGVEFTDERLTSEEWGKLKPTLALGHLPILEVGGEKLVQSYAIHRYVARELGFNGSDSMEAAKIDAVSETLREFARYVDEIMGEKNEDNKAKLKATLETKHFPVVVANLDKLLQMNKGGDGWFVGDKISFADIIVYNACCDFYPVMFEKPLDLSGHPKIASLLKRVGEQPKIVEWVESRPTTPM